jgi:hypothetical protein
MHFVAMLTILAMLRVILDMNKYTVHYSLILPPNAFLYNTENWCLFFLCLRVAVYIAGSSTVLIASISSYIMSYSSTFLYVYNIQSEEIFDADVKLYWNIRSKAAMYKWLHVKPEKFRWKFKFSLFNFKGNFFLCINRCPSK